MYTSEDPGPTILPQVPKVGFSSIFNKQMMDQLNTDIERLQIQRIKKLGD